MSIKLIQPAPVERDEYGYWTHPDFPEWDESTSYPTVKAWFEEQGLEHAAVMFEYDAPQELIEVWEATGEADCDKWEPKRPQGDDWFVLSIHDTEDGPVCLWVRPLARIVEPPKHIESSPFPSAEFRFFVFDPQGADFICFRTVEDRDAKVQDIINMYCDEGWDEEVERVCVGEIGGVAQQVNVRHRPAELDEEGCDEDGDYWGEYETKCDYQVVGFPPRVSQAAQDVIAERRRQVEAEGYSTERDDGYTKDELADAAAAYAMCAGKPGAMTSFWPWGKETWKPSADRRRDLVKANALLLAEIERLDRAAAKAGAV